MKGGKQWTKLKELAVKQKKTVFIMTANGCTAGHITVGNRTATSSTDTNM